MKINTHGNSGEEGKERARTTGGGLGASRRGDGERRRGEGERPRGEGERRRRGESGAAAGERRGEGERAGEGDRSLSLMLANGRME